MTEQALSKTEAIEKVASFRKTLARVREEAREVGERVVEAGVTIGVVTGYAYARARWPETVGMNIPGTTLPALATAGGVLALAGIAGLLGKSSNMAASIGAPLVAGELAMRAHYAGMAAAGGGTTKTKK